MCACDTHPKSVCRQSRDPDNGIFLTKSRHTKMPWNRKMPIRVPSERVHKRSRGSGHLCEKSPRGRQKRPEKRPALFAQQVLKDNPPMRVTRVVTPTCACLGMMPSRNLTSCVLTEVAEDSTLVNSAPGIHGFRVLRF